MPQFIVKVPVHIKGGIYMESCQVKKLKRSATGPWRAGAGDLASYPRLPFQISLRFMGTPSPLDPLRPLCQFLVTIVIEVSWKCKTMKKIEVRPLTFTTKWVYMKYR